MSEDSLLTTSWWEEYRSLTQSGDPLRAEVYLRSHAPTPGGHSHRRSVFGALDRAVADRYLDSYDVRIIGDALCLCESCVEQPPGRRLVERFGAVWDWAGDAVEPLGFEERVIDSSVTGEHHRILVPPELCLLVSVDADLAGVFPCRIDGRAYAVDDFLATLATEPGTETPSRADV